MKKRVPVLLFLLIWFVLGISGCTFNRLVDKQTMPVSAVDEFAFIIVAVEEMPSGMLYRILFINGSEYVIRQNTVYLSYPMIKGSKTDRSLCKVEATGNKLNIKPGEDRMLKVLVPKENYDNNPLLDMQHPNIEISGYIKEVKEINHFKKVIRAELPKTNLECLASKPVIYLYPNRQEKVSIELSLDGKLICTYPEYQDGWHVIANPDGSLINLADNRPYSYLFWEGVTPTTNWDLSKGFVVAGKDSRVFLQAKLAAMGLLPKEYNEFIVYWLPLLEKNRYNLITFAGKEYTDTARLQITPKPDSILRVFMVFKPLDRQIEIEPQLIKPFDRQGFTVVEWGGTELKPI